MENLKAKLKKQGGFTMVELLIVVAIIAILIAVSIPMMSQALEKSRHAVDQANVRDAMALASMEYLVDTNGFATPKTYTYCVDDKQQGYLVESPGTGDTPVEPECTCADAASGALKVKITAPANITEKKPKIEISWKFDTDENKTVEADTIS